jgi:hypothetical protein
VGSASPKLENATLLQLFMKTKFTLSSPNRSLQVEVTSCTPTKRQVAKRQVCKTSGLQNVRFTKRQVFKTSSPKLDNATLLQLFLETLVLH